jgi:hypothetical protein
MDAWKLSRRVLTACVAAASAGSAMAQAPPTPFPLMAMTSAPAQESIEIYYGTSKVSPISKPAVSDPGPVVPASAKSASAHQAPLRSAEALADTLHSLRDGTREISAAAVGVLGKVGNRLKHTVESRPIILASYSMPSLPQPQITLAPSPSQSPQPQVIVVREAAEPPSAARHGLTLSIELLAACSIGLVGVLFAGMAWARGSRQQKPAAVPAIHGAAPPVDPDGVHLMGKYNAGPLRETAEKFDIGPSYHEEIKQKKQVEESSNAAAVEFILSQNLALLAALNPNAAGRMVHTDAEGFAVPEEAAA